MVGEPNDLQLHCALFLKIILQNLTCKQGGQINIYMLIYLFASEENEKKRSAALECGQTSTRADELLNCTFARVKCMALAVDFTSVSLCRPSSTVERCGEPTVDGLETARGNHAKRDVLPLTCCELLHSASTG